MATMRPRPSVLSLFDPLSSSDSDKENDSSNCSFFGLTKQSYSPVAKLRRRLIDVGDATCADLDIRDLIQEELEAEICESFALEEDENTTLTFLDMAKAATPKWTGKRDAGRRTSNTFSTPRTPLTEIVARDEETPLARKKVFKRPIPNTFHVPEVLPLNAVHTSEIAPVIRNFDTTSRSVPHVEALNEITDTPVIQVSIGSSTSTIELPIPGGSQICDTPIPLFISLSSPERDNTSRSPSLPSENRLRPNCHAGASSSSSRYSVDLQASFQMHLSETTFDLLNDKVSFLVSNDVLESFLDHEDEDDCCGRGGKPDKEQTKRLEAVSKLDVSEAFEEKVSELACDRVVGQYKSESDGIPRVQVSSDTRKCDPDPSLSKAVTNAPGSLRLLRPPRQVQALRIVKKPKVLDSAKSDGQNRKEVRTLSGKTPAPVAPNRLLFDGDKNEGRGKRTNKGVPVFAGHDGPRRVLLTEASKARDTTGTKAVSAIRVNGPHRAPTSVAINNFEEVPTSVGRGVSTRSSESRIPVVSRDQRFGVKIERGIGYFSRRLGDK